MHDYRRAHRGPVEQPASMIHSYIDAAMANWSAKAVMPVGSVNSIVAGVVHCVRDVWNIVVRPLHSSKAMPRLNDKNPCGSGGG